MGPGNNAVLTARFLRILRGSVVIFYKKYLSSSHFYKKFASLITSLFDIYKKLGFISRFLLYTHVFFFVYTFYNFWPHFFTHLENAHLDPRPPPKKARTSFLTHVEALFLYLAWRCWKLETKKRIEGSTYWHGALAGSIKLSFNNSVI